MKFTTSDKIFEKFPGLHVGVVVAKNIDNSGDDKKIFKLLEEVEELIKLDFVPEKSIAVELIQKKLAKHKLISVWRAAYEDLGVKPEHYSTNVEAMMVDILQGKTIKKENKLVDCYNYLSLKHIIPLGADDLDKVKGDISLRFATGDENFIGEEKPEKDEVIYADDEGALCRKWNWKECERTKITKETKNAVVYIDGLPPITKDKLEKILKEAKELIEMFCNGSVSYYFLSKFKNSVELK